MKKTEFSEENKLGYDNNSDETNCTKYQEYKTLGDIDELIFPDDEPYYISQR